MTSHLLALSPENITAILGHLYDDTRYSPDHRSLARVARACRQLWSPAVAVLWRTLPTLAPMLFTLPADLCEIPEVSKPRLRYGVHPVQRPSLLREPALLDFERWAKYAHYVQQVCKQPRHVDPPGLDSTSFSSDVWTSLTCYGPHPLLPNLQRLDIFEDQVLQYLSNSAHQLPFAGRLRSLHISTSRPMALSSSLFRKLLVAANQLELLEITDFGNPMYHKTYHYDDVDLENALIACLLAMPRLRVLRLPTFPLNQVALQTVGSLRTLETLNLVAPNSALANIGGSAAFPTMKQLQARVDDLSWITTFLSDVSSSFLESITIVFRNHASHAAVAHLYSTIAQHPSGPTLRKLILRSSHLEAQPPCDFSDALRPLLQLPRLVTVSVVGWEAHGVDDDMIAEIARAWPALEYLEFRPSRDFPFCLTGGKVMANPQVTLAGLLPLARHCPNLHTLDLLLNTDVDVPGPQVLPSLRPSRPSESQLTSLSIGYPTSPPRDPVRTAAFLTEHFPQLIKVGFRAKPRASTETDRGWHMVNFLLLAFCFVREQERDWAARP